MQELTFWGKKLQFEVVADGPDGYEKSVTVFYDGIETITKKKYGFFGPMITVDRPVEIFTVNADMNDTSLNKEWWRIQIKLHFDKIARAEELKNKEFV